MDARCRETGRPICVDPVIVRPGERALCALPYHGLTASNFLAATLDRTIESLASDVNRTGRPITVYLAAWIDSGLPRGFLWAQHIEFLPGEDAVKSL